MNNLNNTQASFNGFVYVAKTMEILEIKIQFITPYNRSLKLILNYSKR